MLQHASWFRHGVLGVDMQQHDLLGTVQCGAGCVRVHDTCAGSKCNRSNSNQRCHTQHDSRSVLAVTWDAGLQMQQL